MRQTGRSNRRNCQWKCFHSFNHILDHATIRLFFNVNSFTLLLVIPSVLLAASLSSDRIAALTSHKLTAIQTFYLNICIFINHPRKRVFCNVSLSNLENLSQRNLRTKWAGECIFRVSGGTNFENFSARRQSQWRLRVSMCLPVCPKQLYACK